MDGARADASSTVPPVGARLNRRELLQIACLAGGWAVFRPLAGRAEDDEAELTPAQRGVDASEEFANPNWKPTFFSEEQNLTMVALCAVMIPATETPGAKEAMANRYADLVLAAETAEAQDAFRKSLKYIDDESARFYHKPFRDLTADEQVEVLIPMAYPLRSVPGIGVAGDAGYEHFGRVKGIIVEGYYSSEIGDKELGWEGAYSHGRYAGCSAEEKK